MSFILVVTEITPMIQHHRLIHMFFQKLKPSYQSLVDGAKSNRRNLKRDFSYYSEQPNAVVLGKRSDEGLIALKFALVDHTPRGGFLYFEGDRQAVQRLGLRYTRQIATNWFEYID